MESGALFFPATGLTVNLQKLHQSWALPAAPPSPGKEQAVDPKASRNLGAQAGAWGLTQSPISSRSSHQAQSEDLFAELPLGAAVRLQNRHLLHQEQHREILGGKAAGLALGVQHRVTLSTAKEARSPAGSKLKKQEVGRQQHSSKPTNEPLFLIFSMEMASPGFVWNSQ